MTTSEQATSQGGNAVTGLQVINALGLLASTLEEIARGPDLCLLGRVVCELTRVFPHVSSRLPE